VCVYIVGSMTNLDSAADTGGHPHIYISYHPIFLLASHVALFAYLPRDCRVHDRALPRGVQVVDAEAPVQQEGSGVHPTIVGGFHEGAEAVDAAVCGVVGFGVSVGGRCGGVFAIELAKGMDGGWKAQHAQLLIAYPSAGTGGRGGRPRAVCACVLRRGAMGGSDHSAPPLAHPPSSPFRVPRIHTQTRADPPLPACPSAPPSPPAPHRERRRPPLFDCSSTRRCGRSIDRAPWLDDGGGLALLLAAGLGWAGLGWLGCACGVCEVATG
jgi:hypothetical protein